MHIGYGHMCRGYMPQVFDTATIWWNGEDTQVTIIEIANSQSHITYVCELPVGSQIQCLYFTLSELRDAIGDV